MEALLLLSPSPEPQNPITDPANSKSHHQSDEEVNYETMIKKKTKPSNSEKRKLKGKKKEINMNDDEASSSSCSTSNSNSTRRVSRVAHRLRNPTVRLGMSRRSVGERQAEALALPLGMSFAAFAILVLQRKNAAGQNVNIDDLAGISATAVTESFANVFGDKLGSFSTNFEKSFNSTLKILNLINESANPPQLKNNDVGSCNLDRSTIDGYSDTELYAKETSSAMSAYEEIQGSATATSLMNELVLHEETRQLSCAPRRSSAMSLTTAERFFGEQVQEANDLKKVELGLKKIELSLKESELGLRYDSNNLGKRKLEIGVEQAAFQADKFKTKLEDTRKAEMVTKIMDCLVVSVFSMLASMLIGAYNFSQKRIADATSICEKPEEKSSSWWVPKQVSNLNSDFSAMICRIRVWVQMCFGFVMICVFIYFMMQRSSGRTQTMPISFLLIFLGIVCGLPVKVCVDTLGGNGKLWLILWQVFCVFQFVANVCTLALYRLMYGPISVTEGTKRSRWSTIFPYWARRTVLYVVFMLALPAITGLLPFATVGEWRDLAMYNFLGESASIPEV
ncbi:hypothetical protein CARUB_v10026163mg [Capsella rubella]|uniref:Protein CPR-5 n=1 Tax=Capsella rubella TaxID=81985 RepID=R0EWB5_9BRAS|nr:protein CPR-5 [Capsella rubella]EOA13146.1 hypothetical protein CARUB_v10026163mg [Capsella rubella]